MTYITSPRFPDDIAFGSRGGPRYNTTVIQVNSGIEKRNINWSYPLHQYNVAYGIRDQNDVYVILELFHIAAGRAHTFPYKDWNDYKSCTDQTDAGTTSYLDQSIGTGNSSTVVFQLQKTYSYGAYSKTRVIKKPVTNTVSAAVSGVETSAVISYVSGTVTFASAPTSGADVTAGFEFDVPVRFDSDVFEAVNEQYELIQAELMLIEVRK